MPLSDKELQDMEVAAADIGAGCFTRTKRGCAIISCSAFAARKATITMFRDSTTRKATATRQVSWTLHMPTIGQVQKTRQVRRAGGHNK